jgi:hypothetical protein
MDEQAATIAEHQRRVQAEEEAAPTGLHSDAKRV